MDGQTALTGEPAQDDLKVLTPPLTKGAEVQAGAAGGMKALRFATGKAVPKQ